MSGASNAFTNETVEPRIFEAIEERVGASFLPDGVLHVGERAATATGEGHDHSRRKKDVHVEDLCVRQVLICRNGREGT